MSGRRGFQLGTDVNVVGGDQDRHSADVLIQSGTGAQPVIDAVADEQADGQRQASDHQ